MNDFVAGHLPFWIVNYTLALVAWACLGRFMMSAFIAPDSPNYIWRGFRLLTDWAVATARVLVPSFVTPMFLPLVAFCWLFAIRWVVGLSFIGAGLAPRITPPA
ncbi:MAG: YggT family protein [Acetobacteraceae bacterium]|nr:YggT family protein [Acetobacteraceae bacterium]